MPRATTPASSRTSGPEGHYSSHECRAPTSSRGRGVAPGSQRVREVGPRRRQVGPIGRRIPGIVREVTNGRLLIARVLSRLVRSRASYAESHPHPEMGAGEPNTGANPPEARVGAQAPLALARQLTPQAPEGELLDARHT